ncbi:hypothetical protein KSP39_PZI016678 [Platanthera zijinensis]|uniref:Uncharacterized protein n=1 Tax=Platanthera zijinensis TaxID=2320716 RepID=A0AAP0B9C9_9ASPA
MNGDLAEEVYMVQPEGFKSGINEIQKKYRFDLVFFGLSKYRATLEEYARHTREISIKLLNAIGDSLGLEESYMEKMLDLTNGHQILVGNRYPPIGRRRQPSAFRLIQTLLSSLFSSSTVPLMVSRCSIMATTSRFESCQAHSSSTPETSWRYDRRKHQGSVWGDLFSPVKRIRPHESDLKLRPRSCDRSRLTGENKPPQTEPKSSFGIVMAVANAVS